jgi:hypothetical protein
MFNFVYHSLRLFDSLITNVFRQIDWHNDNNQNVTYCESNYLFEYLLMPLKLFLGSELVKFNLEM